MKKLVLLVTVLFTCSLLMTFAVQGGKEYDKQSILVKFKEGVTKAERKDVIKLVDGMFKDKNKDGTDDRYTSIMGGRLYHVELKGKKTDDLAAPALGILQKHPAVEYANYNYIHHIALMPNDPRFDELWGMHNTGQTGGTPDADIDAPEAWDISTGSSEVIIGVIDTGVDYNHEDLAANIWTNPNEIPNNGVDDDGNGYIDDIHGVNTITGSGDPMDDHYHGTHCSGTIGAVGNNGKGVVGVCWTVKIIGIKFLNSGGSGTTADAIESVNYAIWLKNHGTNIRVLSNSWGGGGYDQTLHDAISAAGDVGILFTAAAGNNYGSNNDTTPFYPATYDCANILAVASTDHNDNLSSFSNIGPTTVDLGAPGSSILSTFPNNSYSSISGTSMATPHVSGAAGLLLSVNDLLTFQELKDYLMNYGDPIPALSGICLSGKRLNAYNSLNQIPPPEPTFRLSADPTAQTINQGQTAAYTINIESVLGFSNPVALSASSNPAINATITFDPNPGTPGSYSLMDIVTTTSTDPGDYMITVTGVSGSITKTTTVSLTVNPEDLTTVSYTNNTQISIPDNNPTGITSTINVPDSLTVWNTACEVNITHTWIGDLIVKLISPLGTESILHNREGGSDDNIHKTYYPTEFRNENCQGTWTLFVSDNASADLGTLDSWTLTIDGIPTGPVNQAPTVTITAPPDGSTFTQGDSVTFTGTAEDPEDGDISSSIVWTSSINGQFGTGASVTTSSLSVGTHTITAAATDSGGKSGSDTITVTINPAGAITLSANGYKYRGNYYADLTWSGAVGANVNIYRNNLLLNTVPNTGSYTDSLGKTKDVSGKTFVYRVCETDGSVCSNDASVSF
jgi:subtilisin family serine protease